MGYAAPDALSDVLSLLAQHPSARVVAGGTDFFPALGDGVPPETLIDVTRVAELGGITHGPEGWRIGAAVRWSEVIGHPLPPCFDALKTAARAVGSVQIQNVGTVAGNLCNASPAADGVPPLLALEAEVELTGPTGTRRMPVQEFLQGVRKTALRRGEILSAIHIPAQPDGAGSAFEKLGSRKYLVISIVMVAANIWCAGGRITGARVAVGAASPVAQRLPGLEGDLIGLPVDAPGPFTRPAHLTILSPIADVRGSAAYRAEAVAELCDRAIRGAMRHG
ncbi:FAD binding domain-containing protein [Oceaniglobus ichthyenteri]|uniref:FAD binding domain-containing protein n=1 Tax=Oceaniglobus ichthyenteri TaxID=2136177 RepID=UPI000D3A6C31|nr:xanthine dehydrogenase family protein subunit M [Oceaniglobus ichthyenteri]